MEIKVIYEDRNILVIEKPAGIVVFPEDDSALEKTLISYLLEKYPDLKEKNEPPRYGVAHRLDKETSGVLLVAKDKKTLNFLQKQFKERKITKKYLILVIGNLKEDQGIIKTLVGRSPQKRKKQKVYLPYEPGAKREREAITEYRVLKRFNGYTLVEAVPKTGRKHQIRVHFAYLHHPIAGDKLYGFKNQISPKNLKRQFLHASFIKIKLPNGKIKELRSDLTADLKNVIKNL